MTWNYRVVRTVYPNGEIIFAVHEAFYSKCMDTVPHSITEDPCAPASTTLVELIQEVERYVKATTQPVLALVNGKVVEYTE